MTPQFPNPLRRRSDQPVGRIEFAQPDAPPPHDASRQRERRRPPALRSAVILGILLLCVAVGVGVLVRALLYLLGV